MLTAAAGLLAPRPDRHPPPSAWGVAVAGELSRPSGLGEVARLMLAGLDRLGVDTCQIDLTALPGRNPDTPPESDHCPPAGAPLLLHVNAPLLPLALLRLPRRLLRRRRVIGYWAWELPVVPESWRAGLPFVHEVWTLSPFSAAALTTLRPAGVRCVPPPLAAFPPVPAPLDRAAFGLPAEAVVVLTAFSLASSFARKNPLAAIAAHRAAFGDRADRILLLKIGEPTHFADDFRRIRDAVASAPNIRIETRSLSSADLHALMRSADIVLSLHRSEGFGLVPAEAMLLARPVVATGWSGNMSFMDQDCAALVGYRLIPARDPRGVFEAPGAVWAEPDIDHAAAWLRRLADDPALRARLGAAGQAMAASRLGLEPLRAAVIALGLGVA